MTAGMDCSVLLGVLAMIEPRWSAKARLVMKVGTKPDGQWYSNAELGEWIGRKPGTVSRHLSGLAKDRVLLRGGQSGSRSHWYEVNPDVLAWRGVPWTVERIELERRVIVLTAEALAGEEAAERFFARLYGARRADFVARSLSRDNAPRREGAQASASPTSGPLVARSMGARQRRVDRALYGRDDTDGDDARSSLFLSSSSRARTTSGEPAAADDLEVEDATERVCAAILRRACDINGRRRFISPAKHADVRGLVARHGAAALLEALATAAGDLGVPALIDYLAMRMADAVVDAEHRRTTVTARVERLHQLVATFPDDENLRAELVDCQNELATLTARSAAQ